VSLNERNWKSFLLLKITHFTARQDLRISSLNYARNLSHTQREKTFL